MTSPDTLPRTLGPLVSDQATLRAAERAAALLDGLYEHSPWIAAQAWSLKPAGGFVSLDQLKHSVRPALAMPRFWLLEDSNYGFDASPHLPYWLAVNDASFVPLLVPAHQMAHFSRALVA